MQQEPIKTFLMTYASQRQFFRFSHSASTVGSGVTQQPDTSISSQMHKYSHGAKENSVHILPPGQVLWANKSFQWLATTTCWSWGCGSWFLLLEKVFVAQCTSQWLLG